MTDQAGSLKLVPAVMRAAQILDLIAKAGDGISGALKLSDIARQAGLPKSSVHGLCQTLVHLKLLKFNNDGSFSMGPQSVRWANVFLAGSDIVEVFHEAVAQAEGLGAYTLTLSHLDGRMSSIYPAAIPPRRSGLRSASACVFPQSLRRQARRCSRQCRMRSGCVIFRNIGRISPHRRASLR